MVEWCFLFFVLVRCSVGDEAELGSEDTLFLFRVSEFDLSKFKKMEK